MATDTRIEIALPAELLADLEKLATEFGESLENLILAATYRFVADEVEAGQLASDDEIEKLDALLQKGIDDAEAGRTISQDEMEKWWADRKASRPQQIAAE